MLVDQSTLFLLLQSHPRDRASFDIWMLLKTTTFEFVRVSCLAQKEPVFFFCLDQEKSQRAWRKKPQDTSDRIWRRNCSLIEICMMRMGRDAMSYLVGWSKQNGKTAENLLEGNNWLDVPTKWTRAFKVVGTLSSNPPFWFFCQQELLAQSKAFLSWVDQNGKKVEDGRKGGAFHAKCHACVWQVHKQYVWFLCSLLTVIIHFVFCFRLSKGIFKTTNWLVYQVVSSQKRTGLSGCKFWF